MGCKLGAPSLFVCSFPNSPIGILMTTPIEYDFASMIQPPPPTAIFEDPDYNIWCGSMVEGEDGKYHLFYSRWLKSLGHLAWVTHSEVAHAVADHPLGPYKHIDVVLPARGEAFWDGSCTHNPTVARFGKKYYLYYTGNKGDGVPSQSLNWTHRNNQRIGVAVADHPAGPWKRFDRPVIEATPGFFDALCCANPTVAQRPDGSILMVYKAVGNKKELPFGGPVVHVVATSGSPTGPFQKYPKPVFLVEGVNFAAEDPFIWQGKDRYWAVVKDNDGRFTGRGYSLALFESPDGFAWELAKHRFVTTPEIPLADGTRKQLTALERPQVWLDNDGEPAVLFCAGSEVPNRSPSFNVQFPLRRYDADHW